MAIVFVGGEIDAFERSGGGTEVSNHSPPYTRAAMVLNATGSWMRARFASVGTMWATWRHATMNAAPAAGIVLIEAGGPEGAIARVITAASGTGKLQRWDGAAWVDIGAAFSINEAAWNNLGPQSLAVKIGAADGFVRFYMGGELAAGFTGNTATRAGMTGCTYLWFGYAGSFKYSYYSEVIVGDTDNRLYRLVTLAPTANGANTGWVNDVAAVNAYNSPDTTFITSGAAGEKESFALGNLPAATTDTGEVKAVAVSARHNIQSGSGPQAINALVRTAGADHTKPLNPQNKDAFGGSVAVWDINPATGQKWTRAEVDALEAGVQSAA